MLGRLRRYLFSSTAVIDPAVADPRVLEIDEPVEARAIESPREQDDRIPDERVSHVHPDAKDLGKEHRGY